jgi:glycosyltransferase involved in cell wall biosynthesis
MKKKVLFLMANLEGGGAERVTTNIIRQLDSDSYEITLLMVQKKGVFIKDIPSYVTIENMDVSKTVFSIFKIKRFLNNYQPDIVYSTMFMTSIVLSLAILGLKQKPYLVMRYPTSPKILMEESELSLTKKFFLEYAFSQANTILAQTPEMKNEIVYYHKVMEKKVEVFFNPLDKKGIDKKINQVTNPFNLEQINVVAAGRLTYAKAFDTLLYAFKEVISRNPKFCLHIIGKDDGEEKSLFALLEKLNLTKHVTFYGFQENPYRFFYFSDLYVLSSRREGLPNTILENLYLHKPIVATSCIPFMHQLIDENNNGYIVEVDNVSMLSQAILDFKLLPNNSKKTRAEKSVTSLFNSFSQE